jgi:hypothetical protein
MEKKIIALPLCLFLAALFTSCDSHNQTKSSPYNSPRTQKVAKARYDIAMIAVEKSMASPHQVEMQRIETVFEEGMTKYRHEDGLVRIEWRPAPVDIVFTVYNKTDSPVKIVWDEARFMDEKGISHRLIHSGIGYEERNLPQPPTVIAGGINLEEFMHPLDYFQWEEIRGMSAAKKQGYWDRAPFLPTQIPKGTAEELRVKAGAMVGKTFQAILPLEINQIRIDYLCTFRIAHVDIAESEEPMGRNSSDSKGSGRSGRRRPF